MQVTHEKNTAGDMLVMVAGDMDAKGCETLKPALEDIVQNLESSKVILQMQHVEFLDSSGVGAIVFLFKRLKGLNCAFEISGANGQPKDILSLLRIDKAIPVKAA